MTLTSFALAAAAFGAGYLLGRIDTLLTRLRGQNINAPQGFFAKTDATARAVAPAISIDERKVVTDIRTDTLHKTQDVQFGKAVVAADDINASVSKLASLKRS